MDYQQILEEIGEEAKTFLGRGKVSDVIPALAGISPSKFGMAIKLISGEEFTYGDAQEGFSIQSISKLFTLTLALKISDGEIWKRTGREPSGNAFNSLSQLEYENGIPRNPFINAGALVVADYICTHFNNAETELLLLVRKLAENEFIEFDDGVAESEKLHGHRNAALANFLKSFGNLENEVERVLSFYFHQCSVKMSCEDLVRSCLYLANNGKISGKHSSILHPRQIKKINSLMLTCGMYDAVGDFAYRVGLPGKSGIGGGIVAVIPHVLSVCVWSPELNKAGNSFLGTKALELLTTKTGLSIF